MKEAIVVYGSTMGNTEKLAEKVVRGLEKGGAAVTLKEVASAEAGDLLEYDLIVLGCSTWGLGDLQEDFVDFYDALAELPSLEGKKAAVFGPGDSDMYPDTFCDAVDRIEIRLRELGAELVVNSLKVDGDVEEAFAQAAEWGREAAGLA